MEILISVIAFIVIFSLLILIHEFGHFYAAKKAGIKVEEFGLGLPPRIWGKKKGDTIYSFNWIPFGGFVKMYGEDADDKRILKSKKSFAGKSLRARIAVVVAGVFMNFILGIFVLSVGFSVGMQPLLILEDDFKNAIQDGVVEMSEGAMIESIEDGSLAQEIGIEEGSVITHINGQEISDPAEITAILVPNEEVEIDSIKINVRKDTHDRTLVLPVGSLEEAGIKMHDLIIYVSRVVVEDVKDDSFAYKAGIQKGDMIVSMNGNYIYKMDEYYNELLASDEITYVLTRNFERIEQTVKYTNQYNVAISYIFPGAPAEEAGFQKGDIVIEVNDQNVRTLNAIVEIAQDNKNNELIYKVKRNDQIVLLKTTPDETGKIGVGLSVVMPYGANELSVYTGESIATITHVGNVKYPIHIAIKESFKESWRLGALTFGVFGNVIKTAVSDFSVPEGVSGPVGIARLTHMSVQDGFMTVWRFIALLSLSLAAINIFPLPALDGGRLLFLILEGIRGKRINPKWEAYIHTFGFLLLIALILLITFNDLVNWLIKGTF